MHPPTNAENAVKDVGTKPGAAISPLPAGIAVTASLKRMKTHKKHKPGTIEQWETIARKVLLIPNHRVSRSEVDSVLVGIHQSKDGWLKQELQKKREKAWTVSTKR